MQLNEIKKGNLLSVEDIAKWDFEMIKRGEFVLSEENNKKDVDKKDEAWYSDDYQQKGEIKW